jgi:hypothetical protein
MTLTFDLDLQNGAINELAVTEGHLYKRCYMGVRLVVWGNYLNTNDYIQKKNKQTNKWTMSPRGLTVSCKSPPHIRACIDSGSPFEHTLTHIPAFRHTWTQGVNRFVLSLLKMVLRHCVIKWRHSVKILTDLESALQGLSFEVLHDIVPSFWKFDLGVHHFWP